MQISEMMAWTESVGTYVEGCNLQEVLNLKDATPGTFSEFSSQVAVRSIGIGPRDNRNSLDSGQFVALLSVSRMTDRLNRLLCHIT